MSLYNDPIIILDGACGTNLQKLNIPESAWNHCEGCNEYLNLSAPEFIVQLHDSFLGAGAMAIETNTFGANEIVLAEYGLQDRVEEINRAAVQNAQKSIQDFASREKLNSGKVHESHHYIIGSVGPGTKLASLGQISIERLSQSYARQIRALAEAGANAILLETCQDLLQVKTAVISCYEVLEALGLDLPVMVSITIETTGTMLIGTDISAAAAALEPFPLFSLGLNCATGPENMKSHIRYLSRVWPGRISCVPNAGIPQVVDGKPNYPLSPTEFANQLRSFVVDWGVSVVGGCCGTTPGHIAALRESLEGERPAARSPKMKPAAASLYRSVEFEQDIRPLLIGERANANGSKRFRECLLADDFQGALQIGIEQERDGAHLADLCAAYAGRDERADLDRLVRMFAESVKIPIVLDSTTPECIESALRLYAGRCIINSINLEDGGKNLTRICKAAKIYGAAVIALTIHTYGMARTAEQKLETAREIYRRAVKEHGLRPSDIFFDALTFTVGSGDETLKDAALQTLEAIRRIKRELPGVFTILGVSNISFGLPPKARKILNSVFLHEAVEAGLDAAIVDAAKIIPLNQIAQADREICLDLLLNRTRADGQAPLMAFIAHFNQKKDEAPEEAESAMRQAEQILAEKLIKGEKDGLEDIILTILERRGALAIINQVLVPAMRKVGELFGRGEMLLPFVLQSAEVMKKSVGFLEPYMEKSDQSAALKILLATVRGDVHDIGKNLVDIILSNNGFKVFNIGINAAAETIIAKAREHQVDLIGLSGLLVKSALVMKENMSLFREAGLKNPVLLGGAALTPRFVAESCAPAYNQPVVYCADAFAGLRAVQDFEAGALKSTEWKAESTPAAPTTPAGQSLEISRNVPVPEPPFWGPRWIKDIPLDALYPYINKQALFRGRWGYRRGKMSAAEYKKLIEETVEPAYERMKRQCAEERLARPAAAYGYFRAWSQANSIYVQGQDGVMEFPFPRQGFPPHLCIADFYRTREEGGDCAAFFVVTLGESIGRFNKKLYDENQYHDYLLWHGFSVELTDALAEYWHEQMRGELGISKRSPGDAAGYITQEYQGSRYGFGYPACPDLEAHVPVFRLLDPARIGVSLTENMQMVPEQSTSAIIAHHPQAKYFAV